MIKNKDKELVYLPKGTEFTGTISCKHSVYLNGKVTGDVQSSKSLYILHDAVLSSTLEAPEIQISGRIEGLITAEKSIHISDSARVYGTVKCKSLHSEHGALLSGDLCIVND